jgi:hypothetical protein
VQVRRMFRYITQRRGLEGAAISLVFRHHETTLIADAPRVSRRRASPGRRRSAGRRSQ